MSVTLQANVSSKHQIAVPSSVRRQLSIEAGNHLLAQVHDGVHFLIPKPVDPIEEPTGLGREIWEDVDVQEYLDGERTGW